MKKKDNLELKNLIGLWENNEVYIELKEDFSSKIVWKKQLANEKATYNFNQYNTLKISYGDIIWKSDIILLTESIMVLDCLNGSGRHKNEYETYYKTVNYKLAKSEKWYIKVFNLKVKELFYASAFGLFCIFIILLFAVIPIIAFIVALIKYILS